MVRVASGCGGMACFLDRGTGWNHTSFGKKKTMGTDNRFRSIFSLGDARGSFCRRVVGGKDTSFGVSLIELVVVIAILAFLILIAVLNYNGQIARGRDAKRKDDLSKIRNFLEEYYNDKGTYPSESNFANAGNICGSQLAGYSFIFPCDPINSGKYVYQYQSGGDWYRVYTKLEIASDPNIVTVGCSPNGCGPNCQFNYGVFSSNTNLLYQQWMVPCGSATACINNACVEVPYGKCNPQYNPGDNCLGTCSQPGHTECKL